MLTTETRTPRHSADLGLQTLFALLATENTRMRVKRNTDEVTAVLRVDVDRSICDTKTKQETLTAATHDFCNLTPNTKQTRYTQKHHHLANLILRCELATGINKQPTDAALNRPERDAKDQRRRNE